MDKVEMRIMKIHEALRLTDDRLNMHGFKYFAVWYESMVKIILTN